MIPILQAVNTKLTHLCGTHGGTRGPAAASQGLQRCTVLASKFQLPNMACARHLPFRAAANNIHSGALGQLMAEHASCPAKRSVELGHLGQDTFQTSSKSSNVGLLPAFHPHLVLGPRKLCLGDKKGLPQL